MTKYTYLISYFYAGKLIGNVIDNGSGQGRQVVTTTLPIDSYKRIVEIEAKIEKDNKMGGVGVMSAQLLKTESDGSL